MSDKTRLYTVSELARDFEVTPRTVRFYEDKGLLSPRRAGTSRIFDYRDHARLSLVLRFKRLGFELSEIKGFLDLYRTDDSGVAQLKMGYTTLVRRIRQLRKQLQDLELTLKELDELKEDSVRRLAQRGVDVADFDI
jgi:DNA-binding transcriptional MerR regulator